MNHTDTMTAYLGAFVDEMMRAGISHAVISPGSRSTPLAILLEENTQIKTYLHVDERSAAFFALGIAKVRKEPVAILCTSGSAAANYFPAVVEAYHGRTPLVILTADRPHELRDVGAPQAMNQFHLYGNFAKEFVELALPEGTEKMFHYIRTTAARATYKAITAPAGPVHINIPLREPLLPNLSLTGLWEHGRLHRPVHTNLLKGERQLIEAGRLIEMISTYEKGVIICGDGVEQEEAIFSLAQASGYPVLADPLSGMRSSSHNKDLLIECYDTFLRIEELAERLCPEVIIRFGAMPVSKALSQWMIRHQEANILVVDEDINWRDHTLLTSEKIVCDEKAFCEAMKKGLNEERESSWLFTWRVINEQARDILATANQYEQFFEGKIVQEIQAALPPNSILFAGNSMPIRDVDTFFTTDEKNIRIFANRGVNGIDGIVSTALGMSTAGEQLLLLIGDLSFYHDMNGLLSAKLHHLDATIVIVNNDGGGIFSFLPQKKEEKHFEALFGTPIGLDYEHAVKMYGGTFEPVKTWDEFQEKVKNSFSKKGLKVIEVRTDREENHSLHHEIWNKAKESFYDEHNHS